MHYTPRSFDIPELEGISARTITEHLKLYEGYVKHSNKILDLISEGKKHDEYALKEGYRRLGFEFDGMRNHEYYFGLLEGGAQNLPESKLSKAMDEQFGGVTVWHEHFTGSLATTRGVGWAMLGYDSHTGKLINYWVDEQHLGHLTGVHPIVALDMWEHSYCLDYPPSEKAKYVDAFFANINWTQAAKWFDEIENSRS